MIHSHTIMRTVALCLATMVTLTGCLFGNRDDGDAAAKPPTGGWPQPAEGMLTNEMCGLLTEADYKALGHNSLDPLTSQPIKGSSNYVSCAGSVGEWLTLDLQPTAESAKIRYDNSLSSRQQTIIIEKQETMLVQDLLQGADQSWFDYGQSPTGTKPGDYQLQFRRGALVASVKLDPFGDKVRDPKAALIQLAGLVLERIPEVGKADAGTTPKVRFEVKGIGKATAISYITTDHRVKSIEDVPLPWSIELPMSDHGDDPVNLHVSADTFRNANPQFVSCSISVRGTVVKQAQEIYFAICDSWSTVH